MVEVEEDHLNVETLSKEIGYPAFCQSELIQLGTVDENTRFDKFHCLNSAKVLWKNEVTLSDNSFPTKATLGSD